MLKIDNFEVMGWEHVIRGMRNPLNSWDRSDSFCTEDCKDCSDRGKCSFVHSDMFGHDSKYRSEGYIGPNDHDLMMRLRNAGTDHRKFMRMITVYLDITAPLYWWKEFDTYKVGTVANSCSTMHKIAEKEFTLEDFSCEHLTDLIGNPEVRKLEIGECNPLSVLSITVDCLNECRKRYLETKNKIWWWQMIQLLPSSYNQKRTVMLNYEVLANIYKSRKDHKLDEWRKFCAWIEELPHSEIIIGHYTDEEEPVSPSPSAATFGEKTVVIPESLRPTACDLCNEHDCGDSDEEHCKKCRFYKYSKWANGLKGEYV